MMRSRMPVPSLLCLFGALLMLSPEGVMGTTATGSLAQRVLTDAGVEKALAFVVEKYNGDIIHIPDYFKNLRVELVMSPVNKQDEYHIWLEMVKTTCQKKAGKKMTYQKIQKCKQVPGNQKKLNCYFIVIPGSRRNEMKLGINSCK